MSITATIDEPINDFEKNFNIPICTEAVYKQLISPIGRRRGLQLLEGWGEFIEVDHGSFGEFSAQLATLCEEVSSSHEMTEVAKTHILDRIAILQRSMAAAFEKHRDLVVLIG